MISTLFVKVLEDESGATAIEYGLIASLVSIAAVAAYEAMGSSLLDIFSQIANRLDTVNVNF